MATTVVDQVFVDTNILIYARVAQSPLHSAAVTKLQDLATAGHSLWSSRQILREYLASLSKPGIVTVPVPMATLISDVRSFQTRFFIAEDGPAVTSHLLNLLAAIPCGGKQVHDANIVATMLAHGIAKLLTHNAADFNRFAAHITVISLVP
jgi:predicted nucleic acid-binding protein